MTNRKTPPHRVLLAVLGALAIAAACDARGVEQSRDSQAHSSPAAASAQPQASPGPADASPSGPASAPEDVEVAARRVDPRKGGLEVGFGEFAVTLEADAIRPGPVEFVIRNGGELVHGFEIEIEGPDGDSSGSGSGDGFKFEGGAIQPGDTVNIPLELAPGLYKVECFVEGHDDMGMEALLRVAEDAPLIKEKLKSPMGNEVALIGFAFEPDSLEVERGTEVTWSNEDPAEHTVTADDGSFSSDTLGAGDIFSFKFEKAGTFSYYCAIHPSMKGKVTVT